MHIDIVAAQVWADHVADLWADRLVRRPGLRMCLATGATPVPVYREMGRRVAAGQVSLAGCTVFVLDEWLGLPPGHEVRCDTMLHRDLVRNVDLDPQRVHTFDVDGGDDEQSCRRLDAAMRAAGGLDLVILGLGANGHLGMNEPGTPFDAPTRVVELAESTRLGAARYGELVEPPTHGVTVGLGPLLAADEVWLLVTGETKSEVLAATLTGPVGSDLPATALWNHRNARVVADDAAAGTSS